MIIGGMLFKGPRKTAIIASTINTHVYIQILNHFLMWLAKAWTAIDKLSVIWNSDLTDKMKCSLFQAAVVSIMLYGCTICTLIKGMEKKLDGNYIRKLRAMLNKSWRQHPTKQQLYGQLPPFTETIQVRRTRHARHCWRSRDELISDVLLWTPSHDEQRQNDQLKPTYNSSVQIRHVALKTCWRNWTISRGIEKGSGISVLMARHDEGWWSLKNILMMKSFILRIIHLVSKQKG